MISQRLRGLLNLHVVVTGLVAVSFFLLYANVIRYLPRGDLSPDLKLAPYVICVVVGMALAGR